MYKGFWNSERGFTLAVTGIHLVFFIFALHCKRIYNGDSFEYIYEATNIKSLFFFYSGNPSLPILPEYMSQRMPLYPLALMLIYLVTVNNWIVLVLQNALSILNVVLARKMLISAGVSPRFSLFFLISTLAGASQFIIADTIAPDILLQTCTLLYAGYLLKLFQTGERKYERYSGLTLFAGIMVKPVLYPFVIIHLVILVLAGKKNEVKLQRTIVAALLPVVFIFFYNYWNFTRTGKFHLSSNQAFNAIYYFQPYVRFQYGVDSAAKFLQSTRAEEQRFLRFSDRYDFAIAKGGDLFRQHLWSYAGFHILGSVKMLFDPGKAELDLFTGKLTYGKLYDKSGKSGGLNRVLTEGKASGLADYVRDNLSVFPVLLIFLFNVLKLIGFLQYLTKGQGISTPFKLFVMFLTGYFILVAGPIETPRYFLPVSLLYSGFAAAGWLYILDKRKSVSGVSTG